MIVSDNGTELTSPAILRWTQERLVEWRYIAPGKPQHNGDAESFNAAAIHLALDAFCTSTISRHFSFEISSGFRCARECRLPAQK